MCISSGAQNGAGSEGTSYTPQLGVGLAFGGSIAEYIQSDQQARAEDRYNGQSFKLGASVATQNALTTWSQLSAQRDQARRASAQALEEFTAGVISDQSTARVAGLESGAAGSTLGNIVDSYTRIRTRSEAIHRRNEANSDAQFQAEAAGISVGLQSTLFNLKKPKATKPNPFGYLLQGASSGLQAYSNYSKAEKS